MRVAGTGSRLLWWPSWTAMTRLMPTEAERATAQEGTVRRGRRQRQGPAHRGGAGTSSDVLSDPRLPLGPADLEHGTASPLPTRHAHAHARAHTRQSARSHTSTQTHTQVPLKPVHQGCCGYRSLVPIATPAWWGRGEERKCKEALNKEQQLQK